MKKPIYLDYNATGLVLAEVIEKMTTVMREGGNPSSVHALGRSALREVEEARMHVAALVNCRARDIIFTSGGTEANNIALKQMKVDHLFISGIEHESVQASAWQGQKQVHLIPVDKDAKVDLKWLADELSKIEGRALVSVMLANNETGVVQPIENISKILADTDHILHVDAIQAAGKIPVDFESLNADMMTLSGHKIGGPQGVGCLIMKANLPMNPLIVGGGQELGRRSGTENVPGIAGFGKAAELAPGHIHIFKKLKTLRDAMETKLLAICPDAPIYSKGAGRLPNTTNIGMPGVNAETQVMAMDLAGICISSGSACSSGKVRASHVLNAIGVDLEEAGNAIRISFGWDTTLEEVDAFVDAWETLYNRVRKNA
jgi:cysteine desulfurase